MSVTALVLFNQLRLKTACTVTRNIDFKLTLFGLQSLASKAIAAVTRLRGLVL